MKAHHMDKKKRGGPGGKPNGKHGGPGRGRGGPGGPGGRRKGRRGRQHDPVDVSTETLRSWFAGNLPDDWFTSPVDVVFDRDEIVITGDLPMPKLAKGDDKELAASERTKAFREDTREQRMAIADRAQHKFERHVSWAVTCGDAHTAFTMASVPVMSRLHIDERQTLDTLIDAGVARSRSEAVAWAVRLVADNEDEWIGRLRDVMAEVDKVREEGPASGS